MEAAHCRGRAEARRRQRHDPLPPRRLRLRRRPARVRPQARDARVAGPNGVRSVQAMSDYLPFLVVGVTAGSLYGLAGMGLVLAYKTSGVFNFAHGAIAAAGAFAFYELHTTLGWPWPIALVVALGAGSVVFGLGMERVARAVSGARAATT